MPPKDGPTTELGHAGTSIIPWTGFMDVSETVPELAWPTSVHLFDLMRRDAQIGGILRALTMPIRRYRWTIDPNGARQEVVEDCARQLGLPQYGLKEPPPEGRIRNRFNHDDHLRHALLSLTFGHMFFEIVGEIVGESGAQRWQLKKLAPRMPLTLSEIKVARDGGLVYVKQHDEGPGPTFGHGAVPIPVTSLVGYVNDREAGNWFGRSVMREIYKNWLIKDRLLRVDAIKHERNGMGVPTFEAPQGATPTQIKILDEFAQRFKVGEAAGGAVPYGAKLRLVGTEGSLPDTLGSIRYQDQQMSQSMLEMFRDLGTTKTGNRALGQTFIEFFEMTQQAIADWYVGITTAHVIEDIVDWNWGTEEQAPRLRYDPKNERTASVADLVQLVDAKIVTVDDDLEDQIREEYMIAKKSEDVPNRTYSVPGTAAVPPVPPAPVPPAPAATSETVQRPRRGLRAWMTGRRTGRHTAAALPSRPLRRAPYAHEVAAGTDFASMEAAFLAARDDLTEEWRSIQQAQMDDLARQVTDAVDAGNLAALGTLVAPTIGADTLTARMLELAEAAAEAAVAEADAQGVAIEFPGVDAEAIGARAEAIDALMASSLSDAVGRRALAVAAPGSTGAEVAADVREYMGTLSDVFVTDQMTGAAMQAQNTGRRAVLQQRAATYYASELLDLATCGPCASVDGTSYPDLGAAELDYPTGGFSECDGGSRCRGTIVAVYDEATASVEASA